MLPHRFTRCHAHGPLRAACRLSTHPRLITCWARESACRNFTGIHRTPLDRQTAESSTTRQIHFAHSSVTETHQAIQRICESVSVHSVVIEVQILKLVFEKLGQDVVCFCLGKSLPRVALAHSFPIRFPRFSQHVLPHLLKL